MDGNSVKIIALLFLYLSASPLHSSGQADRTSEEIDYRSEMRSFVQEISRYGKRENKDFIVIPQNGQELLTYSGDAEGEPAHAYLEAIDGVGREDLFFGYTGDDRATPDLANRYMLSYLDLAEREGVEVLTIDYCTTESNMDHSYRENGLRGYVSFSADSRGLEKIPHYPDEPHNTNTRDILSLREASNFLYLINPEDFTTVEKMISEISQTNYDMIIIDLFDNDGKTLSAYDIGRLKQKANGGDRLVLAYMSIGEAEEYRYYWRSEWVSRPPQWLDEENPHWEGNYKVKYWEPEWKDLILGNSDSYLDLILEAGFDGVYLDIIDAFEFFE